MTEYAMINGRLHSRTVKGGDWDAVPDAEVLAMAERAVMIRSDALKEAAGIVEGDMTADALRLAGGEMTAQEVRTVRAFLRQRAASVRALDASHD